MCHVGSVIVSSSFTLHWVVMCDVNGCGVVRCEGMCVSCMANVFAYLQCEVDVMVAIVVMFMRVV